MGSSTNVFETETIGGDEDDVDVSKKRFRIELGEYEREIDLLRKENDQLKKEKSRRSFDNDTGNRLKISLHSSMKSPMLHTKEESEDSGSVDRRRWEMEKDIETEKMKKVIQLERDQERFKWKIEKEKELERLRKFHELDRAALIKEKEEMRAEKDKHITDVHRQLEEQVAKVQVWEEEVTEVNKELKNREVERLKEAVKMEKEKSGKQLDEQEREIMRLKTLLYGEKNEWYRLMDQEKMKWKNDRSNELEKLQKEVDAQRNERKSKEREFSLEIRKIEQERIRFSDDRAAWKKELEKSDDKLREKDSEIAKIQTEMIFETQKLQQKHKQEKEELRMFVEERASVINAQTANTLRHSQRRPTREATAPELSKPTGILPRDSSKEDLDRSVEVERKKLNDTLKKKEAELNSLNKQLEDERRKWQFQCKELEVKVKMWEEEVIELEKSHAIEKERDLERFNLEKERELKSMSEAAQQQKEEMNARYQNLMDQFDSLQLQYDDLAQQFTALQNAYKAKNEELLWTQENYAKDKKEWEEKQISLLAELEVQKIQHKDELERQYNGALKKHQKLDEELKLCKLKLEDLHNHLQSETKKWEAENLSLQQQLTKEKDNATLIARQWAEKERKAAEAEKRQWKKDEQKREEERIAREKDWISKLTLKFKEIERVVEDNPALEGEESVERLLRRMEHVRMLLLAKKPTKKSKSVSNMNTPSFNNNNNNINNSNYHNTNNNNNSNNNNNNNGSDATMPPEIQQQRDYNININSYNPETYTNPNPFIFSLSDAPPSVTAADLLEKNLDNVLRELQYSKSTHRELTTQVWDLRRQLGDARKYFEKTLHSYEEQANFNFQHLRRSYEDQIELWKQEARKANRMMELALSRPSLLQTSSSSPAPSNSSSPSSTSTSSPSHPSSPFRSSVLLTSSPSIPSTYPATTDAPQQQQQQQQLQQQPPLQNTIDNSTISNTAPP